MAEARRKLFEETLDLYRTFKTEEVKKARLLCKQALKESGGSIMKEFEDLLKMSEVWLKYDKRRKRRKRR